MFHLFVLRVRVNERVRVLFRLRVRFPLSKQWMSGDGRADIFPFRDKFRMSTTC